MPASYQGTYLERAHSLVRDQISHQIEAVIKILILETTFFTEGRTYWVMARSISNSGEQEVQFLPHKYVLCTCDVPESPAPPLHWGTEVGRSQEEAE